MPVAQITNGGKTLELAYLDEGQGEAVLLIHGFASTKEVNWLNTGWVKALTAAGFRVVAFDNRGHGQSTKFHDPADYALNLMAGDAMALLDGLAIRSAHLAGYSMGARISAALAVKHGSRFGRIVLSGAGWNIVEAAPGWDAVRDALLAPSLAAVSDPRGRAFRVFADQTGSDRIALAACMEGARQMLTPRDMSAIANPVLVAVGSDDDIAVEPQKLADSIPNASFLAIPGRDHMRAVGDRQHVKTAVDFLAGRWPVR